MSDKKWRTWEVLGLLFVLAAGNLLHFVYDWIGQSPVVGLWPPSTSLSGSI